MRTEPRQNGHSQWVPLASNQGKLIARKTLTALTNLLNGQPQAAPTRRRASPASDGSLIVSLDALPELSEVGGIARVECESQQPVAIARIGRCSFAAYRPVEAMEGIEEVAVRYEEETGFLRVRA
jgi:hypothetical protein